MLDGFVVDAAGETLIATYVDIAANRESMS